MSDTAHELLLRAYYDYLFVGGMPEVVSSFLAKREGSMLQATEVARAIQKNLLQGYQNDFLNFSSQHLVKSNLANKLSHTFNVIASELQRHWESDTPTTRFKFAALGKNSEFRRVANVFDLLARAGLIIRSSVVSSPQEPIRANLEHSSAFKCFYFDVGILNGQLETEYNSIVDNTWHSYKGFIAENFVAQELYHSTKEELYSWKNKTYEVEFLFRHFGEFCPIEVKSSRRGRSSPSLRRYIQEYSPKYAFKVSPNNFGKGDGFECTPIYMVSRVCNLRS